MTEELCNMPSQLLELAACDDLVGFREAVEKEGCEVDGLGLWYGMRIGKKKMGLEERTPLMIAAMFGSVDVLSYILEKNCVDVNRICGLDGATALHCAIAGGASSAPRVVRLLIDASADCNLVGSYASNLDALIAHVEPAVNFPKDFNSFELASDPFDQEMTSVGVEEQQRMDTSVTERSKDALEKRGYPIDLSLPDINNGIYETDEFRMYTFKIKPCSRAYSHDWTECPFVHPGENARRRDPRKHHYSCVPCPEFRKGTCRQGDACEYAHGIFECWLHPAQYRTRLCKDETRCNRRVCFFAHKPEELRPLYASTGSAIPSPRSYSASGHMDFRSLSPLVLGSASVLISSTSTPPMTPTELSSPRSGSMWNCQSNSFTSNQLIYNSRLKSNLCARDMEFNSLDQLGAESQHRHQQRGRDEMHGVSSPTSRNQPFDNNSPFASSLAAARVGEFNKLMGRNCSDLQDIFASVDHSMMSQLQNLSLDVNKFKLNTGLVHQNMNHPLRASYPLNLSSSPVRSSSFCIDQPRSPPTAAIAKRSQSFMERSPTCQNSGFPSPVSSATPSSLHGWGSTTTGNLDWEIQEKELNMLRKSASFGIHSNGNAYMNVRGSMPGYPKMSQESPHTKDNLSAHNLDGGSHSQHHISSGGSDAVPAWAEQMFIDQEQTVAH